MTARQQRLTLIACILGSVVVFVDGTVVNVALPAIRADLDVGLSAQQWIVDAYLLTLGSLLLIGGSLGDILGRRRMFAFGVVGFGVTSMLCALSPSATALIVARGLQGIAGALLVPSTLGIITATFSEGERGRAIGTWTAWSGISTVIGPLAGGLILEAASWRWIFAINVLPILVTLYLIRHMSAAHDHPVGGRVDIVGAVLCAIGLGGPVFALIEQPNHGWADPMIWIPLVAGVAVFVAFLVYERRSSHPMLDLTLFRRRNFAVGNGATLLMYGGLSGATFLIPIFLQEAAGFTPLVAGLSLLPISIVMFLLSARMGALADRFGPRIFMGAGPIVAGCGLALLAMMGREVDYWTNVLPGALVFALGLSLTVAPLTATVLGGVDERHAGVASGVNNAIARVAGLVAIAVIGAVVSSAFASSVDDQLAGRRLSPRAERVVARGKTEVLGASVPPTLGVERVPVQEAVADASVDGFRTGMLLGAGIVVLAGLVSIAGIRNPERDVKCADCAGGALAGAPQDAGRELPRVTVTVPAPAGAR
ncbi:MAG TPA: MFS transporter [Solirubrobacteraceae bacterium]|nr:MFS transporter [Solirubrobacteraceae bacterium]